MKNYRISFRLPTGNVETTGRNLEASARRIAKALKMAKPYSARFVLHSANAYPVADYRLYVAGKAHPSMFRVTCY